MIFGDLRKANAETDTKRQISRVNFYVLPNAEILNPRGFGGRDLREFGYQALP